MRASGAVIPFVAVAELAAASLLYFYGPRPPVSRALPSVEEQIIRVEAITYDDVRPYLEGLVTVRRGEPYLCEVNRLDRLPRRDPLLEAIARIALHLFADDGHRIGRHVTERIVDGGSPWGVFGVEALRGEMTPYLDRAKEVTIDAIREHQPPPEARNQAASSEP